MKRLQKSQVLVSVLILIAIVIVLSTALLFHARSVRQITGAQSDADIAYSLAKTGIGIAGYINANDGNPCGVDINATYNITTKARIIINTTTATQITSTGQVLSGNVIKSAIVLTENFHPCAATWVKAYGRSATERMNDVIETGDGQYLVDGWEEGGTNGLGLVAKVQGNGTITWAKNITGQAYAVGDVNLSSKSLLEVSDGYMCLFKGGYTTPANFTLVKLNRANGAKIWAMEYGNGSGNNTPGCIAVNSTGNFTMVGQTTSFGFAQPAGYAIQANSTGTPIRAFSYNGTNTTTIVAVLSFVENGTERYLLAGNTNASMAYGAGDFFAIKTDTTLGTVQYQKIFGSSTIKEYMKAACLSNNTTTGKPDGFILAGYRQNEALLVKTDLNLNFLWGVQVGGNWTDSAQDVIQNPSDGSYMSVGVTAMNSASDLDAFFSHVSFSGTWVDDRTYSLPSKPGNDSFCGACRITASIPLGLMFAGETSVFGNTSTNDWLLARTNTTADINNCAFGQPGGDYFTFGAVGGGTILNKTATFTVTNRTSATFGVTSNANVNDANFTTVSVCP